MKKIYIFTNYKGTKNYGAILQAYALNNYINSKGHDCKTVDHRSARNVKEFCLYCFRSPLVIIKAIADRALKLIVKNKISVRDEAFRLFREKKIPHTPECDTASVKQIVSDADVLICGSDQIWRPGLISNQFNDILWLKGFEGVKKVSYAASMGITELDDEQKAYAETALKDYSSISVRERSTKELLQPLCSCNIQVVMDPVFLITAEDWKQLAVKPCRKDKYIFVYFIKPDKQIYDKIERFAKHTGLKIVYVPYMSYKLNIPDLCFNGHKLDAASPQEFLGYIIDAEYVFTDSFHCTAFSVIFHKNFNTWITNHGTRLISLLRSLGAKDRIRKRSDNINVTSVSEQQWNLIDSKVNKKVQESKDFLESAISGS